MNSMSCDAVVLSVSWDSDSLFRWASTKLSEECSAPLAIVHLSALGLTKSLTSEDAIADAVKHSRSVYGRRSAVMIRKLRKLLQANFHIVPTPAPKGFKNVCLKSLTLTMHLSCLLPEMQVVFSCSLTKLVILSRRKASKC